ALGALDEPDPTAEVEPVVVGHLGEGEAALQVPERPLARGGGVGETRGEQARGLERAEAVPGVVRVDDDPRALRGADTADEDLRGLHGSTPPGSMPTATATAPSSHTAPRNATAPTMPCATSLRFTMPPGVRRGERCGSRAASPRASRRTRPPGSWRGRARRARPRSGRGAPS